MPSLVDVYRRVIPLKEIKRNIFFKERISMQYCKVGGVYFCGIFLNTRRGEKKANFVTFSFF